jgi:hypothetical protein
MIGTNPAYIQSLHDNQRRLSERQEKLTKQAHEDEINAANQQQGEQRFTKERMLVAGRNIKLDPSARRIVIHADIPEEHPVAVARPLYPRPQGGLDVVFQETVFALSGGSQAWNGGVALGGGDAVTLTASSTNYCWLEISYNRRLLNGVYQWEYSSAQIVVNTSATYEPTGFDATLPDDTECKRVFCFAEIETTSSGISDLGYKPFEMTVDHSASMLAGEEGDVLYHNGTSWTQASTEEVTVVTDVQVDTTGKTIQIKTITGRILTSASESGWTTIHTGGGC